MALKSPAGRPELAYNAQAPKIWYTTRSMSPPTILIPGQPTPPKSVPIYTARGNAIPNCQSDELTGLNWKDIRQLYKDNTNNATVHFLAESCARYNCHGLTFGSRRAEIDGENSTISMILNEDCFVALKTSEPVQPGDIAIYYDEDGDIQHSGIVAEIRVSTFGAPVPFVWSKWGKGPEVVHSANSGEYNSCSIVFYRKRRCTNCRCHI